MNTRLLESAINEYLQRLEKTAGAGLSETEATIFRHFLDAKNQLESVESELRQLDSRRQSLVTLQLKTAGQLEAYVTLLMTAETERRRQQVLDLQDVKRRLGAQKIEVVDKAGNVIETPEVKTDDVNEG